MLGSFRLSAFLARGPEAKKKFGVVGWFLDVVLAVKNTPVHI